MAAKTTDRKWIKVRLTELDKTVTGMAQALGLGDQTQGSDIISGKRKKIYASEIRPLAKYLEMSETELQRRLAGEPAPPSEAVSAPSPEKQAYRAVEIMAEKYPLTADQKYELVRALIPALSDPERS